MPIAIYYSIGMAEYTKLNYVCTKDNTPKGSNYSKRDKIVEKKKLIKYLDDEWKEFLEALEKEDHYEILMEFSDVVHILTRYSLTCTFSREILCNRIVWFIYFWILPPASFKLGFRYSLFGCIRNHLNPNNLDHNCNFIG